MKSLLLLSGGVDSSTMIPLAQEKGFVSGIFFDYGQKNRKWEEHSVRSLCDYYHVGWRVLSVCSFMSSFTGALTDYTQDIPSDEEGVFHDSDLKNTVVPNRNMIFCSIAVGIAVSEGFNCVWMGMHLGDYLGYPDCRKTFVDSIRESVRLSTEGMVDVVTPFVTLTKSDVVREGKSRRVPYEKTRSCYRECDVPCGKCSACACREQAMTSVMNSQYRN